ncbi:ATP-dependent DNA helicase PIF1-like protein [Tanacetum coccineum]|uniref:ATP-dependent DNA helicase n=1 Tax=Tanacetum coccineum TaxID=301880 RepID=A0ABQ5G475_9ASTR
MELIGDVRDILDGCNKLVETFRMARDMYNENTEQLIKINLIAKRAKDGHTYSLPTASEVAGLIVSDVDSYAEQRDIVIEMRKGGGTRYMMQNYMDAMPLCKWYGCPDLFITITCNPNWHEIPRYMREYNLAPNDRPDALSRVFKMKLDQLVRDVKDLRLFSRVHAGARSHDELKTIDDVVYPTYKEAYYDMGLLEDDKEYIEAIKESSHYAPPDHLRELFVTLSADLVVTDEENKNVALFYIEELMRSCGSSLRNFEDMPYLDEMFVSNFGNRLLYDELDYDLSKLQIDGTGKTFLWKTLTAGIRWKCDVVLNVASSGITSLLMTDGRTAHLRFKFPINIDELSTCPINPQSDLVALVRKCKLIIWDEALKTHKHCFEALDISLRDALRKSKHDTIDTLFGNMTEVFGGDFRQVLPVISKGSRQYIVGASLKQSYLWDHCKVLRLTINMRLTIGCRPEDVNEIKDFAEWILKLGDGNLGDVNNGEAKIDIPDEMLIKDSSDPVGSIIDFTYPNMLDNLDDNNYFT